MKFKDALAHSIKTLGSTDFIEAHRKEDPKMVKYFPLLADINRHGFLTENSQSGKRTTGKHYQDGTPYVMSERAYLSGYMPPEKATEFIKQLSLHTDKVAFFVPVCDDATSIPSALDIPLTVTTKNSVETITTHMSTAIPTMYDTVQRASVKLNKRDSAVSVMCYDTHWNRDATGNHGLFTEILQVLKQIK